MKRYILPLAFIAFLYHAASVIIIMLLITGKRNELFIQQTEGDSGTDTEST